MSIPFRRGCRVSFRPGCPAHDHGIRSGTLRLAYRLLAAACAVATHENGGTEQHFHNALSCFLPEELQGVGLLVDIDPDQVSPRIVLSVPPAWVTPIADPGVYTN